MAIVAERTRFAGVFARLQPYRLWIQTAFLAVWLAPIGTRLHGYCAPVFHCYGCPLATFGCPIGMLAHFTTPFIVVGMLILFGALLGSLFCGWACPFGWLQDLAAKVPTPKFDPPRWMGHLRFVVLGVFVLAIPGLFGIEHPLSICMICPAGALEAALPSVLSQALAVEQVFWPNTLKLTITGIFLVAIFFIRRPWCRVLCPLGVILASFNRVSGFFLRFDRGKCTTCGRCTKLCKYNIDPEQSPNDLRCIRCLECTRCKLGALTPATILHRQAKPAADPVPPGRQR
jgi:polyferredoxin